jgi:branched-subunit amino acid aminotransferase/4-amino-4-deoxychorismate lyase
MSFGYGTSAGDRIVELLEKEIEGRHLDRLIETAKTLNLPTPMTEAEIQQQEQHSQELMKLVEDLSALARRIR